MYLELTDLTTIQKFQFQEKKSSFHNMPFQLKKQCTIKVKFELEKIISKQCCFCVIIIGLIFMNENINFYLKIMLYFI